MGSRALIIRVAFIVLGLLHAAVAISAEPQKTIMHVGETRPIQFPSAQKVHVTRKGIIHLMHEHDDFWTVTAIRTGIVAVETKVIGAEPRTVFVDVRPRPDPVKTRKKETSEVLPVLEALCEQPEDGSQFEMHAIIELLDDSQMETTGVDSDVQLKFLGGPPLAEVKLNASPRQSAVKRHIIGDPVLTTRACEDVVIRAGGEDEFEAKSEDGHSATMWKSHGLEIKMKIFPVNSEKIKIPFSVSLRTPSKGRGSYALNEITSSIELMIGKKTLAAVLNLSSSATSKKETLWLAAVPIIGPFFQLTDESTSASKLLLWFEIDQRSADSPKL
jgi:hypothetical protein